MAQKTNLNVSPYYDDFDSEKNFYKVLFNPGRPVQARELTTSQSILQNQIESFGSHMFKEGSMVIPGNIGYDGQYYSVKLNPSNFGTDISAYIDYFVGKKIIGQSSGTTATIQKVVLPDGNNVEYLTVYVKYSDSDNNFVFNPFEDGEYLSANESIVYGNTTINAGSPFASLIATNATSIGSAVSIAKGVYFVRGYFANVENDTLILDYYTNTPSYRVGLKVDELIITSKDNNTLFDNAKGFTNYAAPGADRFKINLSLTKKLLTDTNDTDFIELLRVQDGKIKKIEAQTQYSLIKDYFAKRTYDESGDYSVDPFIPSIHNSLNDRLGNNGIFFSNEKTDQGNTPSDDLMCVKISPGKCYVKGYDVTTTGTTILDVDKPRDTESISGVNVPFEMGNLLRVNNASGTPKFRSTIDLYDLRKDSTSAVPTGGTKIGDARAYTLNLTDAAYYDASTKWDLYLYDIQTYTKITLNSSVSSSELPKTSFIKGKSSGATGYATADGSGSAIVYLRQTSGSFSVDEQIQLNGVDFPRTIKLIQVYSTDDIKSVYQSTAVSGYTAAFIADSYLEKFRLPNGIVKVNIDGSTGTTTSNGSIFTGIKLGSIIRYKEPGLLVETFNRVTQVSADGLSITVGTTTSVTNVCDGSLPTTGQYEVLIGSPTIRNNTSGFLYAELPDRNISSVNLSGSNISISSQITKNVSSNSLSFNTSDFVGITSSFLQTFDEERYSIHYSDGVIEPLTSDKFSLSGNTVTVSNLTKASDTGSVINASLIKNGIKSKKKEYNRSKTLNITLSKYAESGSNTSSSLNDGLTYNKFYGLRVQDEEICLNYPDVAKVLAIYESFGTSAPVLDKIEFSASANVYANAIIGENILGNSSKAIARIVEKIPASNILGVVYLNENKFSSGESASFEESNITTDIISITEGKYKNLTSSYKLDKGQKEQYYDYSKIVRNDNTTQPSKQLLLVFDYYTVPTSDSGDVFTVLSYDEQRFLRDIPAIGSKGIRCSDTLDFRPRVPVFSSVTKSPFDFDSRTFTNGTILSPNESSLIGYEYYLARIDKVYVNKFGTLLLQKGISSKTPKPPNKNDDVMEIATITLPPYLYNPSDAQISLLDNRRYTMRDIGLIENRVGNLERVTSLSLLESSTASLQIQDADGKDRFKSGFFVDDFKNYNLINMDVSKIQISESGSSIGGNELRPIISRNTLKSQLAPASSTTDETLDLSTNFELLDSNVQKTGKIVTLKYNSVGWIEQPFATTQENVNPFHILEYIGIIKLTPEEDHWVRTVQLSDRQVSISKSMKLDLGVVSGPDVHTVGQVEFTGNGSIRTSDRIEVLNSSKNVTTSSTDISVSTERLFLGSSAEQYMRSRNTEFSSSNLKPKTQFYHFLDGNSSIDFVPKLVEIANDSTLQNYGASKQFEVGETVIGTYGGEDLITFRVASGDHKYGQFNSPSKKYQINPYFPDEKLPSAYSSSSKVLNIDTYSLCEEAQGKYYGYLKRGMRLVGQKTGAVAYVKDLRLISDNCGDLIGTFFLKNPNTDPAPTVRINTGKKTFRITSSSTNQAPLPGNKDLSSAEALYTSEGTVEIFENVVTTTMTTNETTQTQTWKEYVTHARYYDPLAQTFAVGGKIESPSTINTNDDANGAFLTAVDLYFATKDSGNNPVRVEIRTVEFGIPTRSVLGTPAVLRPEDISISDNAEVATHVVFPSPIYLPPGKQYAIVVIADTSDKYYLWTAVMKEKTVNTASLPDADSIRYTRQFSLGRLYKSQNGAEWTPSDMQDLKFKLYKAEFTSDTGTAFFYNPTLDESNGYVQKLNNNPLTTLPKTATIGITTSSNLSGILTAGRKVGESTIAYRYGTIISTGGLVASVGLTTGGKNYITDTNVSTFNITGQGSGLTLNITASNGVITGTPTIVSAGNGYATGDVVGIVTSTVGAGSGTGVGARITITVNTIDTLYLTGVQAEDFTKNGTANLVYYSDSGSRISFANTSIISSSVTSQVSPTNTNSGNFLKVDHFDHGMYSNTNQLSLKNVKSNVAPVVLTSELLAENISSISVAIGDTTSFATFEGIAVSANNPGYVKIDNEIIGYSQVTSGGALTLISGGRGIDSTIVSTHSINSLMYKYELNGISLRRINKTHDISDLNIGLDGYYVEIDTSANGNGINRSNDGSLTGAPQLSFTSQQTLGGSKVLATENIQFNALVPTYDILTPGSATSINAKIRSVTGTSIGGNETSFLDNSFEPVQLGQLNSLNSTRIVCSKVNESIKLTNLPRNKSFTTGITFTTTDKNLSPALFTDTAFTEFYSNRINRPITDYAYDGRVNSTIYDPHSAVYVSNTILLSNPAKCLKVILSAYCHESSDFRVLYSLDRADSSEVAQSFELFPGYDNISYINNDGYSVVDLSKNSGRPDTIVSSSLNGEFKEYQFTADNLGLFTGYRIKIVFSGTNQAYVPIIKQLRTIAIR
jgi:hypothetical protein